MHETGLINDMLEVIRRVQEEHGGRDIVRVEVALSAFGGWDAAHFREHFLRAVQGTPWQAVDLKIEKVTAGPEAKLVSVRFK